MKANLTLILLALICILITVQTATRETPLDLLNSKNTVFFYINQINKLTREGPSGLKKFQFSSTTPESTMRTIRGFAKAASS